MMSFLTAVVTSGIIYKKSVRTSCKLQQATIYDGKVTVQPVQGRQTSYDAGTTRKYTPGASGSNTGKQRTVICYNCKGEGHIAKQCTKPKRKRDETWFNDKVLLVQAQAGGQALTEPRFSLGQYLLEWLSCIIEAYWKADFGSQALEPISFLPKIVIIEVQKKLPTVKLSKSSSRYLDFRFCSNAHDPEIARSSQFVSKILGVYYVEGLGHNLFSVGQFCDSNLEVAFRQHTCFIRNLEGVDLLTGSRGDNLYTLSLGNMMASSPICMREYYEDGLAVSHETSLLALHSKTVLLKHEISGLVSNPHSSTPFVPPSRSDWDSLFQPMFDEVLYPRLMLFYKHQKVNCSIPEAVAPDKLYQLFTFLNDCLIKSAPITMDTPMVEKSKLDEDKEGKAVDPSHYRGMIGTLIYLTAIKKDLSVSKKETYSVVFGIPKDSSFALTDLQMRIMLVVKIHAVRRDDDVLYKFKEGDFHRLRIQDIEDMLLLLVQGKVTNLSVEERIAFNVSLRMFTRRVVIQRRVEDLQLGVESYQKKLNLTKPDTYRSNLRRQDAYTPYSDPRGFIYENKDKKNRLMRIDELHKFSDGTLDDVRTALNDRLKGIRMAYLPQTFWSQRDKANARAMIQAIDKRLKTRRIMRSLERFVGGRPYGGDLRLLQRTI
ncbi:reverse transcriptase domain-containing protein [Tanacetum coccineum]